GGDRGKMIFPDPSRGPACILDSGNLGLARQLLPELCACAQIEADPSDPDQQNVPDAQARFLFRKRGLKILPRNDIRFGEVDALAVPLVIARQVGENAASGDASAREV